MIARMKKPGITNRLSQLGYLLKHTFALVGRDPGLLRPLARMVVYGLVSATLFFAGIAAVALNAPGWGTALFAAAVAMFIYKFFYYVAQEARQSWLVSETLQGRPRDSAAAKQRISGIRGTCRRIALIEMLVAWLMAMARRSSKAGRLVALLMRGLAEVWDLVNHYLLPAAAVDGLNVRSGVGQMHSLKDNVPESLIGVFGIDIAARAVGTIMAPIYLVLIVGAIGLGLWLGETWPAFHAGDLRALAPDLEAGFLPEQMQFSWLPLLIMVWLGKLCSIALERITTSVKVIYFTLFYMRITHLDRIVPDIRGELEAYLRLEDRPDTTDSTTDSTTDATTDSTTDRATEADA